MDFRKEFQASCKDNRGDYVQTHYQENFAFFSFLLATTTAYDEEKKDFVYLSRMPGVSQYDRFLLCSMSNLEYTFVKFEYILEDLKIKFSKHDQAYFEKLVTSGEAEKVKKKIHNMFKEFRLDMCMLPTENLEKGSQLDYFMPTTKKEIFQSPLLRPVENVENKVYFWPVPGPDNTLDPKLTNIFCRLFSAEKRDTPLRFDNSCFEKVNKIDLIDQTNFGLLLNAFREKPIKYFSKSPLLNLRLITELFLYHHLVLDVQKKLETNLTYKPSFFHASSAAEAVDRYAEIFKGPGYNVYKTVDLIRKIHAMVFDHDMNRFGREAIRTAINRKDHNL